MIMVMLPITFSYDYVIIYLLCFYD